jgi:predicted RNA methylase
MTEELTYIAEGLRELAVPIDELHVDPANARTAHALDRIATSLKAYGQRKPIIANRLQHGKTGDIVLDLFAGSGTTLIACERLGRVCRTMDNDPKFVAVCLERWSQMVGEQPTLEVT